MEFPIQDPQRICRTCLGHKAGAVYDYPIQDQPTLLTDRITQAIEATIQDLKNEGKLTDKRNELNYGCALKRIDKHAEIFNPLEVKNTSNHNKTDAQQTATNAHITDSPKAIKSL